MGAVKKSALVAAAITMLAGAANAESPVSFFQRMLEPTIQELKAPAAQRFNKQPAAVTSAPQRFVKPADTPLIAVPMPNLRPDDDAPEAFTPPETAMSFLPDVTRETVAPMPLETMPTPRLRPAIVIGNTTRARLASAAPLSTPARAATPISRASCGVSLAMLGVSAVPLEEIEQGACGIVAPVEIASLDGGSIDITRPW
jgi:hypothetical protein